MKKLIVLVLFFGISACSSTLKPGAEISGIDENLVAASPTMPGLRSIILDGSIQNSVSFH